MDVKKTSQRRYVVTLTKQEQTDVEVIADNIHNVKQEGVIEAAIMYGIDKYKKAVKPE